MIRDEVCSSRSQQHNIERWAGEDETWISKKNLNYVQVSQLFLSKIVGLEIDPVKQVVSIPETKISAIIQKVKDVLRHTKIT